jgi:outer membrane immunogenic protein
MKKLLLTSAMLCGLAGQALAADAIVYSDPAPMADAPLAFAWTGAYIGGQVGYLWGDGDFRSLAGDATIEPDGWLAGLYAGYNYQMANNIVLGADADFAWSGADDSTTAYDDLGAVGTLDTEMKWEGALRARLGYAVERFLPYVAGGVAFGKLKGEVYNALGEYQGSDSDTNVGWTLGVGLDYAFTDNIIARAEYRYTDLGTFDGSVAGFGSKTDYQTNDVRMGVAYKF